MNLTQQQKDQQREHTLKTMYCKNKKLTESYINTYQSSMKTTIESVIQIGECVRDIKLKQKSDELNYYDVEYFCNSVGIKEDSSTFRKFMRIGEKSGEFKKYLDKLPSSYTVLYEITTLDPELFDTLISQNEIKPTITLKELKKLSGKVPPVNKTTNPSSGLVPSTQMKMLDNQFTITVSDEISKREFNTLILFLEKLQNKKIITFSIPKNIRFVDKVTDNFIDEELVTL